MRIAYIFDTIAPLYQGGYELRGFELAKELVKRGHAVTVFTRAPADTLIEGVRFRAIAGYEQTFDATGYRTVGGSLRYTAAVLKTALGRGIGRFDVVDCNATPFVHVPAAKALAARVRAPLVLSSHEALRGDLTRYAADRNMSAVSRLSLRLSYDTAHHLATTIVATAPSAARGLEAEGWRDVTTTTGGVRELGTARIQGGKRFVSLGRLATEKRVETVVRAFGSAASHHPDATLLIIGDGPCRGELEELVRELQIDERVRFAGSVDEDKKLALLARDADCYVSASRREGLSVATLEAMAQGCAPVISVDAGSQVVNGATEYVQDGRNGLITDGTEAGLRDAMLQVCSDGELLCRISEAAIDTASHYTWAVAARQLESIYIKAVGHG